MFYELTLPLPPKECSPNARTHWARKAKAVRVYRQACFIAFHNARARGQLCRFETL